MFHVKQSFSAIIIPLDMFHVKLNKQKIAFNVSRETYMSHRSNQALVVSLIVF